MKALITNAEIVHAVRTHFGISESVDITFSHVGGLEGLCAVVDQAPILGTDQVSDSVNAIGNASADKVAPKEEATETEAEAKPKRTRRSFKKTTEPEVTEDATEADETEAEEVVEEKPAATKRRFGAKKAAEPVADEDEDSDNCDSEDDADVEVVEEKKAPAKRRFGAKKTAPVVEEDETVDEDQDDEDEVVEEQPTKKGFGARKTVFGKR